MKAVGGPRDGWEIDLPHNREDYIVPILPDLDVVTDSLCSERGIPDAPVEVRTVRYTVRTFLGPANARGEREVFHFLAPDNWSDMQALRHQFSK